MEDTAIRPAREEDTVRVQELRKRGWQDSYVNDETGVTKELLVTQIAKLPVPKSDIEHYHKMLAKPENQNKNLVAIIGDKIIGTVFYDMLENGNGDIGVFVDSKYRGQGIGTKLLRELIMRTPTSLEVTIFAKNKSRELYKKCGFKEVGLEQKHYFTEGVYLPIQRLVLAR